MGSPVLAPEQVVPAFIAALLGEGVTSEQIANAVSRVRSIRLGQDLAKLSARPESEVAMVRSLTTMPRG